MKRLADNGIDRSVLVALDRASIRTFPIPTVAVPVRNRDVVHECRIIIPYHRVWERAFNGACREMSAKIDLMRIPGIDKISRVSIAWSLNTAPLGSLISKH